MNNKKPRKISENKITVCEKTAGLLHERERLGFELRVLQIVSNSR